MKALCIYHRGCADGFGAAWAVWKAFGDAVEFHPGVYGAAPPDVTGRDVILVDFSCKRPVMEAMCQSAASITLLDHHKTAAEELDGLGNGLGIAIPVFVRIDMEKSGAALAWEYFHPGKAIPRLLQHVQDRDLWRFALPNTREILACLFNREQAAAIIHVQPKTLANWASLGKGPRFRKPGGKVVLYTLEDLNAWVKEASQ